MPQAPLGENQARLRVRACGVCGSDIGIHKGTHPRAKAPLVMGHEFSGVIEEIRGSARGLAVGDRVAAYPLLSCGQCFACQNGASHVCQTLRIVGIDCDGGIAEYVNCDTNVLFKIDPSVSDIAAACVEPLAVAVHCLHRSGFKPLDSAAIIGAGPIGIFLALLLRQCGAASIIISDIDKLRLAACRELGFETVETADGSVLAERVRAVTGGVGADVVFECAGVPSSAAGMTLPCRTDGTICLVGVHKQPGPVALADMHFRELRIIASRVYTKRAFSQAVDYVKTLESELLKVATPVIPLAESAGVFGLISDPDVCTIKPIIDCR
jgi:threonine dehydrogenase-like Zn-dependent dehydrogenase